jgi:hypothetical protein
MSKNLMITNGDLGSAPKNAKKRPAVRLSTLDERDSKRAKMTTVAAPSRKNDTEAAARFGSAFTLCCERLRSSSAAS